MLIKTTLREMQNVLFTADSHFNHTAILGYCNRPFNFVTEMNHVLIEEWNKLANDDTTIYHLGDLTLENRNTAKEFLSQLNGKIKVLGNVWHHDKGWLENGPYYSKSNVLVEILPPVVVLEVKNYHDTGWPLPITLCHYPFAEFDRQHYGAWHFHGHCHNNYTPPTKKLMLDVGVDSASHLLSQYRPFTFDEIDVTMKTRKKLNG